LAAMKVHQHDSIWIEKAVSVWWLVNRIASTKGSASTAYVRNNQQLVDCCFCTN
jgi:hypothetical protein